MKKSELQKWKTRLLERRATIQRDLDGMEAAARRSEASGNLSSMPQHMADVSADNYEQDITFGLIEAEQGEVRTIDAALKRVEEGKFGTCEACDKTIKAARLNAIPQARLCIDCKRKEEEGLL
jgi:RNA polymerase-binding protein DksA